MKTAIDGPGGAGKSTVARAVAKKLGFLYVDTGALYRAIGLSVYRKGIDPKNRQEVAASLADTKVSLAYKDGVQAVFLHDEDVSSLIRTPEMSMYASAVSAIPEVRAFLFSLQRDIADSNDVIMDGRDIGTVILPDAETKIFLTASPETRAKRRLLELQAKGIDAKLEDVLREMNERDKNDSGRDIAPAIPAEDAVHIDTSDLTFDEVVEAVIAEIEKNKK